MSDKWWKDVPQGVRDERIEVKNNHQVLNTPFHVFDRICNVVWCSFVAIWLTMITTDRGEMPQYNFCNIHVPIGEINTCKPDPNYEPMQWESLLQENINE